MLPGIGELLLITSSAEADFANNIIYPPVPEIIFIEDKQSTRIFNEFSAVSELIKQELKSKNEARIEGVGTFTADRLNKIRFQPQKVNPAFLPQVPVERVIRQNAEHHILVGDKETTNKQMVEYFSERRPVRDYWWIAAIVFLLIAIAVIGYYIYEHGLNNLANISPLTSDH